jgi:ribosome-associated protein
MTEATDPLLLARRIAALAKERRAADAVLLDVRALVDYTDFFLIVSGQSSRQNLAIAEHIVKTLKGEKRFALSKSGLDSGSWVCLDLGSVVVHVFDPETRVRYDLELLWADAPRIDPEGTEPVPAPVPAGSAATPTTASEPVAAASPASPEKPAESEEGKPKRRRRTVRTAAVEDADAENAPDSDRPPETDVEPADEVPAPAPRRRKVNAAVVAPPPAAKPAKPTKAVADEVPASLRRKSAAVAPASKPAAAPAKKNAVAPAPKKAFSPAPKRTSKYSPPRRPPKNRNK